MSIQATPRAYSPQHSTYSQNRRKNSELNKYAHIEQEQKEFADYMKKAMEGK